MLAFAVTSIRKQHVPEGKFVWIRWCPSRVWSAWWYLCLHMHSVKFYPRKWPWLHCASANCNLRFDLCISSMVEPTRVLSLGKTFHRYQKKPYALPHSHLCKEYMIISVQGKQSIGYNVMSKSLCGSAHTTSRRFTKILHNVMIKSNKYLLETSI